MLGQCDLPELLSSDSGHNLRPMLITIYTVAI